MRSNANKFVGAAEKHLDRLDVGNRDYAGEMWRLMLAGEDLPELAGRSRSSDDSPPVRQPWWLCSRLDRPPPSRMTSK
jgi:hypothetical protein